MKRYFGICLLLVASLTMLAGCDDFNSKASYFDGKLLVEYQQQGGSNTNDSVTMTFYAPGSYHVAFSQTPGKNARSGHGDSVMPKDFDTNINEAPRVQVITQYIIPDFLRVTITRDSGTETHDRVTETHDFQ